MKIEKRMVEFADTLGYAISGSNIQIFNDSTYEIETFGHEIEHRQDIKSEWQDTRIFDLVIGGCHTLTLTINREIKEGIADPYGFTFEIAHYTSSFDNVCSSFCDSLAYKLPKAIEKVAIDNNLKYKFREFNETSFKVYVNAKSQEKFNESSKKATKLLKSVISEFNAIAEHLEEEHKEKQQQALDYFKRRAEVEEVEEPKTVTIELNGSKVELNEEELIKLKKQLDKLG